MRPQSKLTWRQRSGCLAEQARPNSPGSPTERNFASTQSFYYKATESDDFVGQAMVDVHSEAKGILHSLQGEKLQRSFAALRMT